MVTIAISQLSFFLKKKKKVTYAKLKQNEAQSARAESAHKGVNRRSKDLTQAQSVVTLVWRLSRAN